MATLQVWTAVDALFSATTPPQAAWTDGTNFPYMVLDFDPAADEQAYFMGVMPAAYGAGTITVSIFWTATTTGDVVWNVQFLGRVNDEIFDAAVSTVAAVTDSVTASNDLMVATISLTTPALVNGDLMMWVLNRDANNGADTMANDARFLAMELDE